MKSNAYKNDDFNNRLSSAANAKSALLERFRARHVHITATTPLPRETDGEIISPSPTLEVTLRPASLIVKTRPRGSARASLERPQG